MDTTQLNSYIAAAAAVVTGLIALGHALETIVSLTPTKADDQILNKAMGALDWLGAFLPKIRF